MRRSGHHAVLNQLCYQLDDVVHLNNCVLAGLTRRARPRAGRLRHYRRGAVHDTGPQSVRACEADLARLVDVPNLVYSFEDADSSIDYRRSVAPHRSYTVLCVARDPFNWLASSLRSRHRAGRFLARRVDRWKEHVEQCSRPETYPFGDFVDVNYNRWVAEPSYRVALSHRLGLVYSDRGREEVVAFGPGSTFGGTRFDGRASEMAVLARWRKLVDDPRYRRTLGDVKVRDLARSYFRFEPFAAEASSTRGDSQSGT